ncbi:hypothetical protein OE09_1537 [Flavobacteriaceae bacterium MAR_2010_72]|nr:hypothetical protein OE09_1537 [Flavobacteriaceae bacterium MAR_2010_72]TVZ59740.1 hypothetical protein NA63_2276 [Flavobacteriaceae bacterium MAR_2010_105]
MPTVTITGGNTSTGQLTISPSATLQASRGSIVNWIVTASGITITNIHKYDSSIDIFSTDPHAVGGGNSNNWQGTISSSATVGSEETYYIDWTDASGGTHRFDPTIRVNQ